MNDFMEVIDRGECVKYMQLAIDQLRADNLILNAVIDVREDQLAKLREENKRLVEDAWRKESLASDARLREDGEG